MNNMNDDRSYSGLVEKYIGTAYDTVKLVADAIFGGWLTVDNVQSVRSLESFLIPEMRKPGEDLDVILDPTKPYFAAGEVIKQLGSAGYYIYLPSLNKNLANGTDFIDPSSPMSFQGHGVGHGVWMRQTPAGGSQGIPGIQGPPGIDGLHGAPGIDGAPGIQGGTGAPGTDGKNGAIGPAGPGITVKGEKILTEILAITSPTSGDMWISSTVGSMPDPDNENVSIGDGIFYDGVRWIRAGPIQGPIGPTGGIGPRGPQGEQGIEGKVGNGIYLMGAVLNAETLKTFHPTDLADGDAYIAVDTGDIWVYDQDTVRAERRKTTMLAEIAAEAKAGKVVPHIDLSAWHWYNSGHVQGPQGIQGQQGVQGKDGAPGIDGDVGKIGPKGDKGDDGLNGTDGIHGVNGTNGTDGTDGTDGAHLDHGPVLPSPTGYKDGDVFFIVTP